MRRSLYSIFSLGLIMVVSILFTSSIKLEKLNKLEEVVTTKVSSVASSTQVDEEIIHTHIWATKYDTKKHWEYCTVCNRIRNEETHSFTDNWAWGYPTCHVSGNNYSTRICSCGYNYIYRKPHGESSGWCNTGVRMVHFKHCKACGNWVTSGHCYNKKGNLGCTNPGTCSVCGITATKDWHYITRTSDGKGGKCRDCGKRFFDIKDYSLSYTEDYSEAIIKFTFVPLDDSVEFTGSMGAYCYSPNYTSSKWSYDIDEDGSCHYTGVYTFDVTRQRKAELLFLDRIGAIKVNGVSLYMDATILYEQIWQDHEKPVVVDVVQKNQATSGNWATIKELTIKGTENFSKIVTIGIKDKETNEIIIGDAKTTVVDGKFEYKCTPAIEGPEEGREYILTVADESGNVREHTFTIYRTDSRAPLLKQTDFTEWSQTKYLKIPISDYGSGLAQTSLDSQYSYKDTLYNNGLYYGQYVFAEEDYGVNEHIIYIRDGLGNARREVIQIGKVDNTKPTIKNMEYVKDNSGVNVKITGDDYSKELEAQGSGVSYYGFTESSIQEPTSWSNNSTLRITTAGDYYIWVKDKAGNVGDVVKVAVTPQYDLIVPEKDVTVNAEESNIRINGDKFLYAYYSFDLTDRERDYRSTTGLNFSVYGEKSNEEVMYMYLSTSPEIRWNTIDSCTCNGKCNKLNGNNKKDACSCGGECNEDCTCNCKKKGNGNAYGHYKDKANGKAVGHYKDRNKETVEVEIDLEHIAENVSEDPYLIKWNVINTREEDRLGYVYQIKGNNLSTVYPTDIKDKFLTDDKDKKNIYLHVISESGKEYVTRTSVIKRVIFDQH